MYINQARTIKIFGIVKRIHPFWSFMKCLLTVFDLVANVLILPVMWWFNIFKCLEYVDWSSYRPETNDMDGINNFPKITKNFLSWSKSQVINENQSILKIFVKLATDP